MASHLVGRKAEDPNPMQGLSDIVANALDKLCSIATLMHDDAKATPDQVTAAIQMVARELLNRTGANEGGGDGASGPAFPDSADMSEATARRRKGLKTTDSFAGLDAIRAEKRAQAAIGWPSDMSAEVAKKKGRKG